LVPLHFPIPSHHHLHLLPSFLPSFSTPPFLGGG
jgi:hypothetical protein